MAEYRIFHNPRCSKSRQALEILESNKKDYEIFLYLQETLDKKSIKNLLDILGLNPKDILRAGEIGRAHVRTPVTEKSRMPSSA